MPLKRPATPAAGTDRNALRSLGRWLFVGLLACAILITVVLVCAWRMPASLLTRNMDFPPAVQGVYGSVRDGGATLQGGYRLRWESRISVFALPHLTSDLTLEGPDTRVTAKARVGVTGVEVGNANGRAGPGLAAFVPGAWQCDMVARVSQVGFGWHWRKVRATGNIDTPQGSCTKAGRSVEIPPLALALQNDGPNALVVLTSDANAQVARARIRCDRVLELEIAPAAADIFPQLPRGGPINLQLPF